MPSGSDPFPSSGTCMAQDVSWVSKVVDADSFFSPSVTLSTVKYPFAPSIRLILAVLVTISSVRKLYSQTVLS